MSPKTCGNSVAQEPHAAVDLVLADQPGPRRLDRGRAASRHGSCSAPPRPCRGSRTSARCARTSPYSSAFSAMPRGQLLARGWLDIGADALDHRLLRRRRPSRRAPGTRTRPDRSAPRRPSSRRSFRPGSSRRRSASPACTRLDPPPFDLDRAQDRAGDRDHAGRVDRRLDPARSARSRCSARPSSSGRGESSRRRALCSQSSMSSTMPKVNRCPWVPFR